MKTYFFFSGLPQKHKVTFTNFFTYQNLAAVRAGSIIFLLLNVVFRLLYIIFPLSLTRAQNFPEFNSSNWVFIVITPIFIILSNILIRSFKKRKKSTPLMVLVVFLFALYIVTCGMYSSFIATSDPSNALTLYLIALCLISVTIVMEYLETLVFIVTVGFFFSGLLIYSQTPPTEMVYNQIISVILLAAFYFTSRYFFTFKADNFQQVIEIKEKNRQIEKANEFKNQVLGMVAHDLRNPIGAVESIAMMMEMDEIDEETSDNLNMIKASCAKARSIIEDLLDAARNENNTDIKTEKTELNELLKSALQSWHKQKKTNVIFTSNMNPAYALINSEKIYRVIDNLVSNAIKFSNENQKVDVRLNKADNDLVIEVQDYGLGIPKDLLPDIFTRFTRAGRTGLRGERSTGLGLSIVRQIIESHNGSISVESHEGKGSVFVVKLPAA
ncbi:MAG TPA: HAMP domain-containing sensor histidine kinase [Mucilaginibacter sp.]